jgi:hypothetical protein
MVLPVIAPTPQLIALSTVNMFGAMTPVPLKFALPEAAKVNVRCVSAGQGFVSLWEFFAEFARTFGLHAFAGFADLR